MVRSEITIYFEPENWLTIVAERADVYRRAKKHDIREERGDAFKTAMQNVSIMNGIYRLTFNTNFVSWLSFKDKKRFPIPSIFKAAIFSALKNSHRPFLQSDVFLYPLIDFFSFVKFRIVWITCERRRREAFVLLFFARECCTNRT